jgi:hypothetical protein
LEDQCTIFHTSWFIFTERHTYFDAILIILAQDVETVRQRVAEEARAGAAREIAAAEERARAAAATAAAAERGPLQEQIAFLRAQLHFALKVGWRLVSSGLPRPGIAVEWVLSLRIM